MKKIYLLAAMALIMTGCSSNDDATAANNTYLLDCNR